MAGKKTKINEEFVEVSPDSLIAEENIVEKSVFTEENLQPAIMVDNRFVDRIMGDMDYRVKNMYESLQLTADKGYIQENRIMFLVHLLTESLKLGGILRIPKEFNLDINGAILEGDFLVVTKK